LADFILAAILLVLLLPLLALAGLVHWVGNPGPFFFTQKRCGRNGRLFSVVKLRTMRSGRRPDPKELVPLHHPEITAVGRFLRRLKIDELPQLINVLKGEMSLIGPRPTLPDQVEAYDDFRRQRLLVTPGLTGLAQAYSSAAASWDERILYDIAYVRRCSLLLDLRILFRTFFVVVASEERTCQPFRRSPFSAVVPAPPGFDSPQGL